MVPGANVPAPHAPGPGHATARPPGSKSLTNRALVLAAALKEDISPQSTYVSRELTFDFNDEYYEIHNYDYIERGEISLSDAMAESDNTVFVQLAVDVGLNNVVETAEDLAAFDEGTAVGDFHLGQTHHLGDGAQGADPGRPGGLGQQGAG